MSMKPWDARIAYALVHPLRDTMITPNHITTLRLLVGVSAAVAFAVGRPAWSNFAAVLYVLGCILDHADGELARFSGKTSTWGHYYDLFSDSLSQILVFVGIGYGLRESVLGSWAMPMGIVAGLSVAIIFTLRMVLEDRAGKEATAQPEFAGFQLEDTLYVVAPVTWFGWLVPFLVISVIGLSVFAVLTVKELRRHLAITVSKGKA